MKEKVLLVPVFLLILGLSLCLAEPSKTKIFCKEEILKLTDIYVNNNLQIENPAFIDVDGDGDFDILSFKDGNVAYYENAGTLEQPDFILKNRNYDSYKTAFMMDRGLPLPVFFADADGDGDVDLFAVKEKGMNSATKKKDYRILYSVNNLDIDTATLITIILILVIVLLVLAIVR
jgi:VCBS repeat protein